LRAAVICVAPDFSQSSFTMITLLILHAQSPAFKKRQQRYVLRKHQELPHSDDDSQSNKTQDVTGPAAQQ
jgi:hypothetical protein